MNYIDAISIGFPAVKCHATGDLYSDLIWDAGDPIPDQTTLDTWCLNKDKEIAWEGIKIERDRRKANGTKVGTDWFHSDTDSRVQQLGLVMMGANLPSVQWKTLSGSFVLMTPTLALQIFSAVAASDIAIFTTAETHKAYMMASNDPANYNYMTGWPLTYGE